MSPSPRARAGRPRVFSIPADKSFLSEFIEVFLSGAVFGQDSPLSPEVIGDAVIFVPTRRAAQALGAALAASAPAGALLLPRILPLGDVSAAGMTPDADWTAPEAADDTLPPAMDDLHRRLELFEMVEKWRLAIEADRSEKGVAGEPFYVARSRADAFALTADLARLIDETIIEDVPLSRLAEGAPPNYDPARHDVYWDLTARFLEIAARIWPELLAEQGLLDGADRTKQLIRAYAHGLEQTCPASPVVIAGSTGSVAATADLMAVVARLPMGAVVLPGLDLVLDDPSWSLIGAEAAELPTRFAHPQGLLKRTLARIGIARADVARLPPGRAPTPRERLLSEIFRPAETTERWQMAAPPAEMAAALSGIALVEAGDEGEEALAIALAMRETLEQPGATAALVTPDRVLARQVQNELERWGVTVADTAGEPLARTDIAVLAQLALEACAADAGAAVLLALLRNPACLPGDPVLTARAVDAIEIAGMRGKRFRGGVAGLVRTLEAARDETVSHRMPGPRRRLGREAIEAALSHACRLQQALAPLAEAFRHTPSFRAAGMAHARALALLASADPAAATAAGGVGGEAAEALAAVLDRLANGAKDGPLVALSDYAQMFADLIGAELVRSARPAHQRLKIWGPLEARLLAADRVILGGLNEGVWPPETRGDPFLNRPMRIALGLQPPERRIGQTAHDFSMLLGAGQVILTRARKRDGSPAVASRFLRRLTAFAGEANATALKANGQCYLDWARALDRPSRVTPVGCPAPKITPERMPARLSLTQIETLYRDPYAIFARNVLGLDPLDPVDPPLDARDKGNVIHQALGEYVAAFGDRAPVDAAGALLAFGRTAFAPVFADDPESAQFWWRRFTAFAPWFVEWDSGRRAGLVRILTEQSGMLDLALPQGRALALHTRADRIELRADGTLAIVDYKSGTAPTAPMVRSGIAPQLTLTAALASRGAFPGVALRGEPAMAYLEVAKAHGEGIFVDIRPDKAGPPLSELVEKQFAALQQTLNDFVLGSRGFESHRRPMKKRFVGAFDHLARHLEWSLGGEAEEGDE